MFRIKTRNKFWKKSSLLLFLNGQKELFRFKSNLKTEVKMKKKKK